MIQDNEGNKVTKAKSSVITYFQSRRSTEEFDIFEIHLRAFGTYVTFYGTK